jgi:hypothetical protein
VKQKDRFLAASEEDTIQPGHVDNTGIQTQPRDVLQADADFVPPNLQLLAFHLQRAQRERRLPAGLPISVAHIEPRLLDQLVNAVALAERPATDVVRAADLLECCHAHVQPGSRLLHSRVPRINAVHVGAPQPVKAGPQQDRAWKTRPANAGQGPALLHRRPLRPESYFCSRPRDWRWVRRRLDVARSLGGG